MKTFKINTVTSFGVGLIEKKAKSHQDAFKRLCKSDRERVISIIDSEGNEVFFNCQNENN